MEPSARFGGTSLCPIIPNFDAGIPAVRIAQVPDIRPYSLNRSRL